MTAGALLAVLLAAAAGVLAGRAWAAVRRGDPRGHPAFRTSAHYTEALHSLSAGQLELAITELAKAAREDAGAVDVQLVLGNLLREAGRVERAIQVHQALIDRDDLARTERVHAQVCLGSDFRTAGFLDRAWRIFREVLDTDPGNIHALMGLQKLHEEQRQWQQAFECQTRLSRLRKTDDSMVLAHLKAEMGREAARAGRQAEAEAAFRAALALNQAALPAHLGLAELSLSRDPRQAARILEDAIRICPERAYLVFDHLARAYAAAGEPSRFALMCERIIRDQPRDWRARLALARNLRDEGRLGEAFGLLLRAVETNPQVLLAHLETWLTLKALGAPREALDRYVATAQQAVFFAAPHVCTACRYRAEEMLWRCPHCHNWNSFVEERWGPPAGAR